MGGCRPPPHPPSPTLIIDTTNGDGAEGAESREEAGSRAEAGSREEAESREEDHTILASTLQTDKEILIFNLLNGV